MKLIINQTFTVCPANYYDSDCNTPCGHCRGNDVCSNITGHCPNGCQSQWQGDRCDGTFIMLYFSFHNEVDNFNSCGLGMQYCDKYP